MSWKLFFLFAACACLSLISCPIDEEWGDDPPSTAPIQIAFISMTVNGSPGAVTSTAVTMTFDKDLAEVADTKITVSGAKAGALSGSGTTRELAISDFNVADGTKVTVSLSASSRFVFVPSSRTVKVCYSLGLPMVAVPAGTFQRDDTAGNTSTLTAFKMSTHEITRAQFETIMGKDPSNMVYSSGATDPVQEINWYHAVAFCNKLSLAEDLTPVYGVTVAGKAVDFATLEYKNIPGSGSSNADWNSATVDLSATGYRLPTEMEWMWAAMGAKDARTKAFAGSTGNNDIKDYGWFNENASGTTHPVGKKAANELGLYDMSGNVLEWCWDWHGTYPTGAVTDYRGPTSGTGRINRGGSWTRTGAAWPLSERRADYPYIWSDDLGFRVVRR
jgi:formylglycine-generating enzyme required for sulfatase activity